MEAHGTTLEYLRGLTAIERGHLRHLLYIPHLVQLVDRAAVAVAGRRYAE